MPAESRQALFALLCLPAEMFQKNSTLSEPEARILSPRLLAHLGDAVFHLYERERELLLAKTASQIHRKATIRSSASGQANLLERINSRLNEAEADIVRRARNMKAAQRHSQQAAYRLATAFEALLGYLYLTNADRLDEILSWTLEDAAEEAPADHPSNVKDRL